jgi:hypothetical protein
MQRNCGVLAYDKLVGELNGRANEISMNTLAKLSQDNGFILYPLKVPVEHMTEVPLPCIVYTQHHFQFMEDLADLAPVCMSRKFVYILSHELVSPDWVMDEKAARNVKGSGIGQMFTPPKSKSPWEAMTSGSTGGWAGFAGPSTPTNPSDPKGWGWVGPVATGAAGLIPGVGPLLAAGMGASGSMGGGTGFQGTDKGWGNVLPTLGGALGGYGAGMLGSGIGGAVKGAFAPGAGSLFSKAASGFGTGVTNYNKPVTNFFSSIGKNFGFGGGTNAAGSTGLSGKWLGTPVGATGLSATQLAAGAGGTEAGIGLNWATDLLKSAFSSLTSIGQSRGGLEGELFSDSSFLNTPELQAYIESIGQAKTQLGQMGRDELARVLQSPVGSIIPDDNAYVQAMLRRTEEAAVQRKEAITSNYNAIGRANSSEHIAELNKVDQQLEVAKQDLAAVIANEKIKLELDYRITALSGALGVDQQAAAELAGLTNLSVQEAALKYGIAAQEVAELRKMAQMQELVQQMGYNSGGNTGGNNIMSTLLSMGLNFAS